MFKHNANNSMRSLIAASSLLLSATAFAAGGGGGGDDGDNGCTSNCGFQRGPDPTVSFLEASSGPYSVETGVIRFRGHDHRHQQRI